MLYNIEKTKNSYVLKTENEILCVSTDYERLVKMKCRLENIEKKDSLTFWSDFVNYLTKLYKENKEDAIYLDYVFSYTTIRIHDPEEQSLLYRYDSCDWNLFGNRLCNILDIKKLYIYTQNNNIREVNNDITLENPSIYYSFIEELIGKEISSIAQDGNAVVFGTNGQKYALYDDSKSSAICISGDISGDISGKANILRISTDDYYTFIKGIYYAYKVFNILTTCGVVNISYVNNIHDYNWRSEYISFRPWG